MIELVGGIITLLLWLWLWLWLWLGEEGMNQFIICILLNNDIIIIDVIGGCSSSSCRPLVISGC